MDDEQGKLKFEGFYKKGQKNGKGKEYDEDGNIIFEGEFIFGKKLIEKFHIKHYDRKLEFETEIL